MVFAVEVVVFDVVLAAVVFTAAVKLAAFTFAMASRMAVEFKASIMAV